MVDTYDIGTRGAMGEDTIDALKRDILRLVQRAYHSALKIIGGASCIESLSFGIKDYYDSIHRVCPAKEERIMAIPTIGATTAMAISNIMFLPSIVNPTS